jgi:putative ABC transport system substrate-binding protein
LEDAPRDPDHAVVLADLDPDLHRLPLGIPAGALGERWLGNGASRAILVTVRQTKNTRLGRALETVNQNSSRPVSPARHRMRRRELMLVLGGAMTAASGLRAQQKAMPVIGYLGGASPGPFGPFVAAFRQGLTETGYVEGQNLAIEYRWAESNFDRLPSLAADLVSRDVKLIATSGGPLSARAAKNATTTIPIVFVASDPVEQGLVTSLARPGGNLTGFSVMAIEVWPKRLELLFELVPRARTVALLVNPTPSVRHLVQEVQEASRAKGLQLHILKARTDADLETAFASLVELQAGSLVVDPDGFFSSRREQLVALASRHVVPAIYAHRQFVAAGGLISYGIDDIPPARQVGIYAGKILKGAKPADLPVEQPTKFELVVNLKTAKALGLTIPPSILPRADEVIE